MRAVGAPKGGRVHWILLTLSRDFKKKFICEFDYRVHKYAFFRYRGARVVEVFLIAKTSCHSWRGMYYNVAYKGMEIFSHSSPTIIAYTMELIAKAYEEK